MKRTGSLNRVFRLVWNEVLNCWIAVAEKTKGRGKGTSRKLTRLAAAMATAAATLALPMEFAQAAPLGGQVTAGAAAIVQSGNTTTINQTSQNLSLGWKSFNVGAPETVNFVQPSASAIAVNRIADTSASQILGNLNANGQVYLINPNGILFGQGAHVNVGSLAASTLDLSDATMNSSTRSFSANGKGDGTGSIVNKGTITAANGGYIALIGRNVSNQGVITAQLGTVVMGAGSAATLTFKGTGLASVKIDQSVLDTLVENGGLIQADGGLVIMNAGAQHALLVSVVNNTGVIEARTLQEHNGTITLLGSMSAGTVNVGGTLDASAPNSLGGGNGGFIETSAAHVKVADAAHITTLATTLSSNGLTGTWLIDPTDYTIAGTGGDISGTTLSASLVNSGVMILSNAGTHSGSTGSGNVNVNDTVTWSAHQFTLNAQNNININTAMYGSGTASLALLYGQGAAAAGNISASNVNAPVNLPAGQNFITKLGSDGATIAYTVLTRLGAGGSTTATDLQGMNRNLNGNYVLGGNIDASNTVSWNGGAGFAPVGINSRTAFSGHFDGLGHTISNLTINRPSANYVGLFSDTNYSAVIQNVGLVGGSVSGASCVGGLVGYNNMGTISNSYTTGSVSGHGNVGGLVGVQLQGSISNSYATGNVTGATDSTGGLAGYSNGTISNSYAMGDVVGFNHVGGLVGYDAGSVNKSYATGSVSGNSYVGGLMGTNYYGTIDSSFAAGSVSGTGNDVGGLTGHNAGTISNSYAAGHVSGNVRVGGLVGYTNGMVSNSYATGSVVGVIDVGGLMGFNYGDVNNSYATGSVSGNSNVGGLVGTNYYGTIDSSYATGSVNGTTSIGGLVGVSSNSISNSYATGSASGQDYVGGLVGVSWGDISNSYATGSVNGTGNGAAGLVGFAGLGNISNSYATGSVSGVFNVGGLIGLNWWSVVSNSYWNTETSGTTSSSGGTGLSTAQMQIASNFAGFNFTTTPGGTGNNWVMVDADGSLNNAGGAVGATRPMLAFEYSNSIVNAHQLQLIAMAPAASYILGANVHAPVTAIPTASDVWFEASGRSGFLPVGNESTALTSNFDGLSHTAGNLTIIAPDMNFAGSVRNTGSGAVNQNVGILDETVSGDSYAGGPVVSNTLGDVSDSYSTGAVGTGGLIGSGTSGGTTIPLSAVGSSTLVGLVVK